MATSSNRHPRNTVMSIRTQPDEQRSLIADIEAAKKTQHEIKAQHEILPRYSWHVNFPKSDPSHGFRRIIPPILRENDRFKGSLLARSSTFPDNDNEEENVEATTTHEDTIGQLNTTRGSWHQTGEQRINPDFADLLLTKSNASRDEVRRTTSRGRTSHVIRDDDDRAMMGVSGKEQQVQSRAWCQGYLEEQRAEKINSVPQLIQCSRPKSKRTLRKSVKGSLSSTKDFFRVASKSRLNQLRNSSTSTTPSVPHIDSFETKEHLKAYFGDSDHNDTIVSPISPTTHQDRSLSVITEQQPVELSAGELPVELEDTAPDALEQTQTNVSRASTPDVRDLPPYLDDNRYVTDIVKEQGHEADLSRILSLEGSLDMPTAPYFCSNCDSNITGEEIYNFCSQCKPGDCVICCKCAHRGLHCQHRTEQDAKSNKSSPAQCSMALSPVYQVKQEYPMTRTIIQPNLQSLRNRNHEPAIQLHQDTTSPCEVVPSSTQPSTDTLRTIERLETDLANLRLEFKREMRLLRRENDVLCREQEVTVRTCEVEMKTQQATLRDLEVDLQQKSETLLRGFEALVAYQQSTKGAFVCDDAPPTRLPMAKDQPLAWPDSLATHDTGSAHESCNHRSNCHSTVAQAFALAEASIKGLNDNGSQTKSCPAQKRKKDGNTNGSTGSSPSTTSSPENPRKSFSRGNSDRIESNDEDEEEDNRRYPKKHKQDPTTPNGQRLLFACPYSKFDPQRFSSRNTAEKNYRGCGTHYLPDVSRLKQHLKRVHWQPETYCPRCFEDFDNAGLLSEHAQANIACIAKECPFPEKMDRTQQDRIHVKRPRVPPETVWYDIFRVLFPGAPLPDSPYMEGDDRVITPLSATPQSSVNIQAIQQLSTIFNQRLNHHEELQNHPLRPLINQVLTQSMTELLGSFMLTPTHSPIGGPSIVVSPVSRSSSGKTQATESPNTFSPRPSGLERKRSVTNVVSQPQQVPKLQEPKPKPKLKTANVLQVPPDLRRSPLNHTRRDSLGLGSPADAIFDINILPHIREDRGYDDESQSFEQGDDQTAMGFAAQLGVPSFRNKSVMSLDSGYGSGRSQRPVPNNLINADYQMEGVEFQTAPAAPTATINSQTSDTPVQSHVDYFSGNDTKLNGTSSLNYGDHKDHGIDNYSSYSEYLQPSFQDLFNGTDDPFTGGVGNPWSIP